jgi:hypothetical protein
LILIVFVLRVVQNSLKIINEAPIINFIRRYRPSFQISFHLHLLTQGP